MKLADLRRLAIRREMKIGFTTRDGMECLVTERGIAQSPGLKKAAELNFEEELAHAREFRLEPAGGRPGTASRQQLEAMIGTPPAVSTAPETE